jgi:hypothetical protein
MTEKEEMVSDCTLYCFLSSLERGALMINRRSLLVAEKQAWVLVSLQYSYLDTHLTRLSAGRRDIGRLFCHCEEKGNKGRQGMVMVNLIVKK